MQILHLFCEFTMINMQLAENKTNVPGPFFLFLIGLNFLHLWTNNFMVRIQYNDAGICFSRITDGRYKNQLNDLIDVLYMKRCEMYKIYF